MKIWWLNFLIKAAGGFLTAWGLMMLSQSPLQPWWILGFFTIGLGLLFAPEIGKEYE